MSAGRLARRRELKNGRVLSGFEDAEPVYLPTFGYDELLPLLWERTPSQGIKSPGATQKTTLTAPKTASPHKKPLRRSGSFSSVAAHLDEYCQKPMWADRVLWRGTETGTLEQVRENPPPPDLTLSRLAALPSPAAQSAVCSGTAVGSLKSEPPATL